MSISEASLLWNVQRGTTVGDSEGSSNFDDNDTISVRKLIASDTSNSEDDVPLSTLAKKSTLKLKVFWSKTNPILGYWVPKVSNATVEKRGSLRILCALFSKRMAEISLKNSINPWTKKPKQYFLNQSHSVSTIHWCYTLHVTPLHEQHSKLSVSRIKNRQYCRCNDS